MKRLDRQGIAACVPHAGAMLLIDEVLDWDENGLRARTASHRRADNPLREACGLAAACGVEYAAQAMAIHAGLASAAAGRAAPGAGMLIGLRGLQLLAARLDEEAGPLDIEVRRSLGDTRLAVYDFTVAAGPRELLRGSATVMLDAQLPGAAPAAAAGAARTPPSGGSASS
jgi:predicted hotdog family 3-hydroxylacyl-ACP dehydratase